MEKNTEQIENSILTGEGISLSIGDKKVQIKPPTLGVLDRMSGIILKMKPGTSKDLSACFWQEVKENAQLCAEAIAVAVLGEEYTPEKQKEMASFVKENLPAGQLRYVYLQILNLCDIGNFIGTIRWMGESTTTSPNRIENKTDLKPLSA